MKKILLTAAGALLFLCVWVFVAVPHGEVAAPAQPETPHSTASSTAPTPALIQSTSTPLSREKRFEAYLTGYSYWDNTPPGSTDISHPVAHSTAGGMGTYADPITLAVGHSITNGVDALDYKAGTLFYLPYLRKYFIVEDTCGDGDTPQNGPCHTGYEGHPWFDLWIDGSATTQADSNRCAEDITDLHVVIQHPLAQYAVNPGPISGITCTQRYGEEVLTTP